MASNAELLKDLGPINYKAFGHDQGFDRQLKHECPQQGDAKNMLEFVCRTDCCLPCRKTQNGFSLLEIVLVVFIIGVLLTIALPTYQSYVSKGNRSDAKQKLSEIMFEQERHHFRRRTYTTNLNKLGYGLSEGGVESDLRFYRVTASRCSVQLTIAQCVELKADPIASRMPNPEKALSLNSRDQRKGQW